MYYQHCIKIDYNDLCTIIFNKHFIFGLMKLKLFFDIKQNVNVRPG